MPATVYHEVEVRFDEAPPPKAPCDSLWHPRFPLLGIAFTEECGGEVRVVEYSLENDKTRLLDEYSNESARPQRLAWHPVERSLVVGWTDGHVSVWTAAGGTARQSVQHTRPISLIRWSSCARLVTADDAGSCICWQLQGNTGQLQFQHEVGEALADLAFNADGKDFFVASTSSVIYGISEGGSCQALLHVDGTVVRLLHSDEDDSLVTVTDNLVVSRFRPSDQGRALEQISRVKLAGSGFRAQVEWLTAGTLVVAAGEPVLRLVNLRTNENAVLKSSSPSNEVLAGLAVDPRSLRVAAATADGRVFVWSCPSTSDDQRNSQPYEARVSSAVKAMSLSGVEGLLSVVAQGITVFRAREACRAFSSQLLVTQVSARQARVDLVHLSTSADLDCELPIRALFAGQDVVAASNGERLAFYELQPATGAVKFVGAMNTTSQLVALHEQHAFVVHEGQIEVRSFQGALRQTIAAQQDQGDIVSLHLAGYFMLVASSKGFVRLWDVSGRREVTSHAGPKLLPIPERARLHSARCNANGSRVSATVSSAGGGHLLPLLYVWDVGEDDVSCLDFNRATDERNRPHRDVRGTFPADHVWDAEDPRLLLVECHPDDEGVRAAVAMVFATAEFGLVLQDAESFDHETFTLIGVLVPFIYMASFPDSPSQDSVGASERVTSTRHVYRRSMRDFVGVESCDRETREAILKLSFYLTVGNLDEAFAAIRSIKSESVWENMARMCVQNKRLDVASICLGKMKRISAAMALRQAQEKYPDNVDLQVATLAIHLGMIAEAKDLLEVNGDHRMLVKLLCDSNRWEEALELVEKKSRINLKNTYFRYAKHLEELGRIQEAIVYYEKSNTHLQQVPRMLAGRDIHALETYIVQSREPQCHKWWAQYLESQGDTEEALRYYEMAKDFVSLIRINCFFNNVDTAMEIANEVGDRAACSHLARHLESIDRPSDAVHFFSKAGALSNALRVCKDNGMDDQLFYLAVQSRNNQDTLDVAAYFEQGGETHRAVTLYQKAGWLEKARELSGDTVSLGDELIGQVAQEISPNSDASEVQAATKRLIDMGLTEQAVEILALNGQTYAALDLCGQHDVELTEPLAQKMLRGVYGPARTQLLNKLADFCVKQKSYFLAAKQYTEAGDNHNAMNALVQSEDTDKVILLAQAINEPGVYVQAANYLQTLNWRSQPAIMRHIIEYYTAAGDTELLGNFYENCALSEIAEYQNYETALSALNEAYKLLKEAPIGTMVGTKIEALRGKIKNIQQFLNVKKLYSDGEEREALERIQQMLQTTSNNPIVRKGDLYAFIVEHYVNNGRLRTALRKLEEMEAVCDEGANSFLPESVLNKIFESTGGGFSALAPKRDSTTQDPSTTDTNVAASGEEFASSKALGTFESESNEQQHEIRGAPQ